MEVADLIHNFFCGIKVNQGPLCASNYLENNPYAQESKDLATVRRK